MAQLLNSKTKMQRLKWRSSDCFGMEEKVLIENHFFLFQVLINLTHNFSANSQGALAAGQKQGMIDNSLHVLLQIPQHIPDEEKFDCTVLALILLINLVEHNDVNRRTIIHAKAPAETESIFESKPLLTLNYIQSSK